ncbi:hypothetical protein DVA43_21845 [Leclercia sp. W6]|nr:hypothetical protein DVA43_21845 [Leclercia sp. W6]
MWLMKTLLTSGCTNQRGAGQGNEIPVKGQDGKSFIHSAMNQPCPALAAINCLRVVSSRLKSSFSA